MVAGKINFSNDFEAFISLSDTQQALLNVRYLLSLSVVVAVCGGNIMVPKKIHTPISITVHVTLDGKRKLHMSLRLLMTGDFKIKILSWIIQVG